MDSRYWVVAGLAAVILAVSKSAFGGGPGVVCVPMVASITQPQTAVAVMLPLMILCDVFCVYQYGKHCVWGLVWRLLGGFVIGIVIATLMMMYLPGQQVWLKKVIGVLAISFSACYFFFLRDKRKIEEFVPQGVWFGLIMGVIAGVCSTLAAAAGPPVQIYLLSQAKTKNKEEHLGTISVYALIGNSLKVPSYIASGAMTTATWHLAWPLALIIPVGLATGVLIFGAMGDSSRPRDPRKFNDVVNALLVPIGLYLLLS
ncbi:MAG: sulfite exporter TauE/SafE family protein [Dehalococcoidales bacterium]|nr:sulfite exporter TauE/SafE family protein [Dehalococcoidales bacterium]